MWNDAGRLRIVGALLFLLSIAQTTQATKTWASKSEHRHAQHMHHRTHQKIHRQRRLPKPAPKPDVDDDVVDPDLVIANDQDAAAGGAELKDDGSDVQAPDVKTKKEPLLSSAENFVQNQAAAQKAEVDTDLDEDAAVKAKLAEADKGESGKAEDEEWDEKGDAGSEQGSKTIGKENADLPSREDCEASGGEEEGCGGSTKGGVVKVSKKADHASGSDDSHDAKKKHEESTADGDGEDAPPPPKKKLRRHAKKKRESASSPDFMQQLKNMDPEKDPMELEAQREGVTFNDDDDKLMAPTVETPSPDDGAVEGDAALVAKPTPADNEGSQEDTDAAPAGHHATEPAASTVAKKVGLAARIAKARQHPDIYHQDEDDDAQDRDDVDAEEAHEALKHPGGGMSEDADAGEDHEEQLDAEAD